MALSRKDYKAVAEIIKNVREHTQPTVETVALMLAGYFQEDNPRFNYGKFKEACGITEEPRP